MSRKPARLFVDQSLAGSVVEIADRDANYLGNVLRLKRGDALIVFNGRGEERHATVQHLSRRRSELAIVDRVEPLAEPRLEIVLIQALVKADAMDAIVQKATELGVSAIHAVKTDFSVVKLDESRAARRVEHWHKIAQSACEQSGRHRPPLVRAPQSLADSLAGLPSAGLKVAFHTSAPLGAQNLDAPEPATVHLLVGPEGGFSEADLDIIDDNGFVRVGLGPRVLRADTAAVSACTMAQLLWGDAG